MSRLPFFALALVLVLNSAVSACSTKVASRPNILLISVDTLRADHLGCYGYDRKISPNIDALARRGVLYENVMSASSWTLPAHASLLTGLYPAFHGLQNDDVVFGKDVEMLAEMVQRAGYYTFGVSSQLYVSGEFGFDKGFDRLDDSMILGGEKSPRAGRVVTRFLELLDAAPRKPFFAFAYFYDPHWDYIPPEPWNQKFTDDKYQGPMNGLYESIEPYDRVGRSMPDADRRQLIGHYDNEIAYLDSQVGRLLKELEKRALRRNTVIIFTADHGEEFMEHGRVGHGLTLYRELLRVPLIVAGDDAFPENTRRSDLVSIVDVAPTVLGIIGEEAPAGLPGRHLAKTAAGPERTVISETIRRGYEVRAARQGPFKVIHRSSGDDWRFFDLLKDPTEVNPLDDDPTGGSLMDALVAYGAVADAGWHLKILAPGQRRLRFKAVLTTTGRFVDPGRTFNALNDWQLAHIRTFELSDDRKMLTFDIIAMRAKGEVRFDTDPPEAPVTFEVSILDRNKTAGVFVGATEKQASGRFTLKRSDPRLTDGSGRYDASAPGLYIRAVSARHTDAAKSALSEDAIERLKALGYID